MIVIQLLGGLGNQIFQYAAARRLAAEKDVDLRLDISAFASYPLRTYKLDHFEISGQVATLAERDRFLAVNLIAKARRRVERKFFPYYRRHIYDEQREYQFEFDILKTPKDVYLRGYFQNEGYFKSIEPLIRHDFTLKTPPSGANLAMVADIRAVNAVSLHIRRGDYANDPNTEAYHGLLSLDYYYTAVERMAASVDNPHFFVFSDDPTWAREHLRLKYPMTVVDHNDGEHDYEDLRLMSLCHHHIIANSSFSWWGAWLSECPDKIVYAPKIWVKATHVDALNVTPPDWMRL